jgi:hypothetical protein
MLNRYLPSTSLPSNFIVFLIRIHFPSMRDISFIQWWQCCHESRRNSEPYSHSSLCYAGFWHILHMRYPVQLSMMATKNPAAIRIGICVLCRLYIIASNEQWKKIIDSLHILHSVQVRLSVLPRRERRMSKSHDSDPVLQMDRRPMVYWEHCSDQPNGFY